LLDHREELTGSIAAVRRRIDAACRRSGRAGDEVTLVAATKTVPVSLLLIAHELGLAHFGENRANDLATKSTALATVTPGITWHFFGRLQTGTARRVADHADVVHSGQPGDALMRLGQRTAAHGKVMRWLAQVDFTDRPDRGGVIPEDLDAFVEEAGRSPGLRLVGLMTLPPRTEEAEGARPFFARLRELRDGLRRRWPEIQELSMGMSLDLEMAVEEGATMVRVGTALFGERLGSPGRG
jgi:pyridoxal phosphate enzyme (YggS family)